MLLVPTALLAWRQWLAQQRPLTHRASSVQSEASLANGIGGLSVSPSAADLAAAGPSRTVTGVLGSKPMSRDIKIDSFSMGLNGIELIQVMTGC